MSEKNADGLVPGQSVDFATLMRIKRQKKAIENEQPKAKPRTRKAKASPSD